MQIRGCQIRDAPSRNATVCVVYDVISPHWYAYRCFATLIFALCPDLGLSSEAVACHCFAIQAQYDRVRYSRGATAGDSLGCKSEVIKPWHAPSRNATACVVYDVISPHSYARRCFATLTFALGPDLGLSSEAGACHCFAIQSQCDHV